MNALLGALLMVTTILLFRYLKAHTNFAERIRQTVPGSWVLIPMFIIFGFISGATMVTVYVVG